jgi:signal transduction histidine kinase
MRLAEFILGNIEPILVEWEAFARSVWPGAATDPHELRDHAADILRATASDMTSVQSTAQQSDKSKGDGDAGAASTRVDGASDVHAIDRVRSGFDLKTLIAEYRALRASVIRLWRESRPDPDQRDLADLTRFNESIDQSLTEAVRSYTDRVDYSRQMFLAILGHDLRNPLNAMTLLATALSQSNQLDAEAVGMTSQMADSAAAMSRMITDLLDFTAAGLGGVLPLTTAPMDMKKLCQQVVDEIRAAFPNRTLCTQLQGDLTGEWDAARLRQVLSNLLGNAIQHGVESIPVDLWVSGEGSDVVLSIRNGGPPIPRDALPTIFEPLVRGTPWEVHKPRRPGSIGLGLYIAREVVTAHGGTIHVTSTAQDGTAFTVRLPRRAASR